MVKLAVKIKANNADQVDYVLHQLENSELLSIQFLSYEVDDHLLVAPMLGTLSQLGNYKASKIDISKKRISLSNESRYLCISNNGDVIVLKVGTSQSFTSDDLVTSVFIGGTLLGLYFSRAISIYSKMIVQKQLITSRVGLDNLATNNWKRQTCLSK